MSSNKRNIDPGEVSKPSPGPIRPSGTANHRRENELAEEDRQRRDDDAELCEGDPDEPMTAEQTVKLRLLCEEADEDLDPALSRVAAERQIRRLQHKAGRKPKSEGPRASRPHAAETAAVLGVIKRPAALPGAPGRPPSRRS
jgi:hypothetical protein